MVKEYLKSELDAFEGEFVSADDVNNWMNHLKKECKVKGKNLFMGMRAVLTGSTHGPDLKILVSLIPVKYLKERVSR